MPEKLGGAELDPVHSLEVLENLSYGDASAGWVTMAANLSIGTAGAYLSDHAVAELWGDGKQPVIAGQGTRPGPRRWSTVACCSADRGASAPASSTPSTSTPSASSKRPVSRGSSSRRSTAVNLIDNWDVMGLCGTGSIDYTMDVGVRAGWVEPLRGHHDGRSAAAASTASASSASRSPATAAGRWASAGGCSTSSPSWCTARPGAPGAQADSAAFQQGYAEAEAKFRAARALGHRVVDRPVEEPVRRRRHLGAPAHLIRLALATSPRRCTRSPTSSTSPAAPRHCAAAPFSGCSAMCTPAPSTSHRRPNVWQTCGRELIGVAEGKQWQFLDLVDPH